MAAAAGPEEGGGEGEGEGEELAGGEARGVAFVSFASGFSAEAASGRREEKGEKSGRSRSATAEPVRGRGGGAGRGGAGRPPGLGWVAVGDR